MTPERERWAIALLMERQHGQRAGAFVEARVADLAAKGDTAGAARWRSIGQALEALSGGDLGG